MMKNLYVPTIRSHKATDSLKVATLLANKFQANMEVILLEGGVRTFYCSAEEDVISQLYKTAGLPSFIHQSVQPAAVGGSATADLIEMVYPQDDLLVIEASLVKGRYGIATNAEGTKGLFASDDFFMDDYAEGTKGACAAHDLPLHPAVEDLLKQVHCPILTVLTQKNEKVSIKTVVFVTDGEEGVGSLFAMVSHLQRIFRFNLHLLHINRCFHHQPVIAVVNSMRELAKKHSLTNYQIQIMEDYTYEEGIIHFADKVQPDMIALPIDGHKVISLLLESVFTCQKAENSIKYLLTYKTSLP